jgi:hypothetical protein
MVDFTSILSIAELLMSNAEYGQGLFFYGKHAEVFLLQLHS